MCCPSPVLNRARNCCFARRPCLTPQSRPVTSLVIWFLLFTLAAAMGALGQELPGPNELLDQLNQVSIDRDQVYVLRNTQIARDRAKIYFNRGFIGFLTPVAGEVNGAVFSGDGEILLVPPNPAEKRNLAQFTHAPILEERFASAYLRFTDQTARELLALARKPDPEDVEQPTGFVEEWTPIVRRLSPDHSIRVLQDLLGDRSRPYFYGRFQGENLGVFEMSVDERLPEAVELGAGRRSQGKLFADLWCAFPSQASQARASLEGGGPVRVLSYKIDARINPDNSLEGRAELELESHSSVDRVLTFELSRRLEVSEVKDAQGRRLVVFQNPSLEESRVAARGNDRIVVVLPLPHPAGERFRLVFSYKGNVIANVGNGVLYVGARGSWYPNRTLADRATYDLTFHYPTRLTLVATGRRVEETSSEGWKRSHWLSDRAIPVAGFNLGVYESRLRKAGDTTIEVYAARQAEAALERSRAVVIPRASPVFPRPDPRKREPLVLLPMPAVPLEPSAQLVNVAESAARALQYFESLFGSFPYPRLAISQVPGTSSQGWAELIYLPTLSFLSAPQRSELVRGRKPEEFTHQIVIAHEIAHQWWGNLLGWKTYHDAWLSEGFSSYAAALFLAQQKDGERKFHELLLTYKQDLLTKTKMGNTVESGGPIWLGFRLSNSLDPSGYANIVYKKACWSIHMLRMLMTEPARGGSGPDQRFFKMLRDFVAAYQGRNASTEDFIRHAEKYINPAADLEHNGRLDWFFSEWVYGTGIPTYKFEATTQRLATNKFLIQGRIEQSEVPSDFEMLVPVVAFYGNRKVTLGRVAVTESGGKFRFTTSSRPTRVTVDEDSVLAVAQ